MRPTKPRPRSRRPPATATLVACALAALAAGSAHAGGAAPGGPGPAPAGVDGAREDATPAKPVTRDSSLARSAFERLGDRLRGLPLRPVRIGRPARRPDDPEPGMGVVVRIPF